jgi:xanthine dehydrogenase accessory factor
MMVDQRATELLAQRIPFVRARVVVAERPTSAKPGDQAIVLADGTIEGFVGGQCAESTVRAQALALLDSGETLLLRITPTRESISSSQEHAGRLTVHNPCLSGGTLEIFLEPVKPAPLLVIVGDTPIARALSALAEPMGYLVSTDTTNNTLITATAVVIASHGRDEEDVLRAALGAETKPEYVGLVASRKRGDAVLSSLGLCSSHTARVSTPAGLDIGARTPQEIALSILAEIVSRRPRPSGRSVVESPESVTGDSATPHSHVPGTAIDLVCSMTVATVESSLHLDHDGQRYWFCGSGCLRAFAATPAEYLSRTAG